MKTIEEATSLHMAMHEGFLPKDISFKEGVEFAQIWYPVEELTYEKTNGRKFIGRNKYGCVSTARISYFGINADDVSILPFVEWRPIELE